MYTSWDKHNFRLMAAIFDLRHYPDVEQHRYFHCVFYGTENVLCEIVLISCILADIGLRVIYIISATILDL